MNESQWYLPGRGDRPLAGPVDGAYRWDGGRIDGVVIGGVTVVPFTPELHGEGAASRTGCGQGGQDTCRHEPVYSVQGPHWRVSACQVHLFGALYDCAHRGVKRRRHEAPA
jgi:hypothetical protein